MTHRVLDQPKVLQVLFHPKRDNSFKPMHPNIRLVAVEVEPGVFVRGRLYPASTDSPAILLFHGNGEIAADYDAFAEYYTQLDVTLLVIDYRGYGASDGNPTASNLLSDAVKVFYAVGTIFESNGLHPKQLYVMGRSLGSAAAIEVALIAGSLLPAPQNRHPLATDNKSDENLFSTPDSGHRTPDYFQVTLAGLIVESGFADTFTLLTRLGLLIPEFDEERHGFGNAVKISQIATRTLIIHGEEDLLIKPVEAQKLYYCSAAQEKQVVLIKNAGHNTLMIAGVSQGKIPYFEAIGQFVIK